MDKVRYSITVYVEGNKCNLNCSYCYIKNARWDDEPEKIKLDYDIEQMIKAFDTKRIGGIAEITVIGSAETLIVDSIIPFVHGLLRQGHVVTVVTNATLEKRIKELVNIEKKYLKRLIVKASLHYLELVRLNLLDVYFSNIKYVIESGASCFPFIIISNDYLPYLDEISQKCMENLEIKPQCSPCNEVVDVDSILYDSKFNPEISEKLYEQIKKGYDTRIFDAIVENKKFDSQEHFCYAGMWSFGVDFATGKMSKCHNLPIDKNFYEDIEHFDLCEPVACSCGIESCCLQYNFFSEGLLPDYDNGNLLGDMLYTEGYVNREVCEMLNVRFDKIYGRLSDKEEAKISLKEKNKQIKRVQQQKNRNPFFKEIIYKQRKLGKYIYIYIRNRWIV